MCDYSHARVGVAALSCYQQHPLVPLLALSSGSGLTWASGALRDSMARGSSLMDWMLLSLELVVLSWEHHLPTFAVWYN